MEEFVGPSGLLEGRSVDEIHRQAAPFGCSTWDVSAENFYFRRLRLKRIQSDT
jgi:hypothetical protein